MCKYFYTKLLLFGVILLAGCQNAEEKSADNPAAIQVSWELITNFTEVETGFDARFTLTNKDEEALDDRNWALFFNMSPRPIIENKIPQPATIEHINGDWYKMIPNKGFSLKPGDSVMIQYSGTEGVIKESDAPMGLYFVFYDQDGNEKRIAQVEDFKLVPFTRKEQLLRGVVDRESIRTPEFLFEKNASLSVLPESQLQQIVPSPVRMVSKPGALELTSALSIRFEKGLENEAGFLQKKLKELTGTSFNSSEKASAEKGINLRFGAVNVNGDTKEAYQLTIDDKGVTIVGNDAAGVFYGIQSLLALAPAENYLQKSASVSLPYTQIDDAPRFHFRSLHADVSRNFQTKETILRVLDLLAFYKVNHFLLYTTEDEGWRLEIDGLPELTQVGGQREHTTGKETSVLHPSYGSGPKAYQKGKHGSGYYTKADFIEILKYANERHITVIPELNFPGHARAAIKAMEARYERLMKEGKKEEAEEYRLIDPDDKSEYLSAQSYKDNVVSVARESTYRFYEKVMVEISKMYEQAGLKLETIHAGGDEVASGAWTKSPMAAKLLEENPNIGNAANLQAYFFRKLLGKLQAHNFTVHGWEEVALTKTKEGHWVPNPEFAGKKVVPYIWNNMFDYPDLGYKLANAGYPVVLCNVSNFYFDLAYNNDPQEPGLYWAGFDNEKSSWTFAPFDMFKTTFQSSMGEPKDYEKDFSKMERLKPEARKNILGLEAQLWSETIKGRDMIEYYMLPKLLGFAESAWSPERKWETVVDKAARFQQINQGWNVFANTLAQKELPRLSAMNGGYNYRLPLPGAVVKNGFLTANSELPGLTIRYTTDGSEPTSSSAVYNEPVKVAGTVKLKCFDKAGRSGRTTVLQVSK
jgi:hexosaminidase